MNKKELIAPISIALLSFLFAIVCLLVFVSGGRSKRWIAHKMKIGGILLSLSAVSAGSGCTSCYDMPEPLLITIDGSDGYDAEIDLDTGNVFKGNLYMQNVKDFSFIISDMNGQQKQAGPLVPLDGEFGQQSELFSLEVDNTLDNGDYYLKFFSTTIDKQNLTYPFKQFYLKIKND